MISIAALASNDSGSEPATARKDPWYVETRAGIMPMLADAIEESLQRGVLRASTKVWRSGMQAWQPLGSIACFTPQPDERSSGPASRPLLQDAPLHEAPRQDPRQDPRHDPLHDPLHDPPLRALASRSWGPPSEAPTPAPAHTLIRPIAHDRRGARARARAQPSREHARARGLSWVRRPGTLRSVLFSAVVGTALGLAVYHPLLRRAATQPVTQVAEQAPGR